MELPFGRSSTTTPRRRRTAAAPVSAASSSDNRLQKAIDRNRSKQLRRSTKSLPSTPSFEAAPKRTSGIRNRLQSLKSKETANPIRGNATRVSVGTPSEQSFIDRFRRPSAKSFGNLSYDSKTSTTKFKPKVTKPAMSKWMVYSGWIISFALFGRLIFSDGGLIDYYQGEKSFSAKIYELNRLDNENLKIEKTIDNLLSNKQYQKKLVRDHLGFISSDEYMVLFARD